MFIHPTIIYLDSRARGQQFNHGTALSAGYDLAVFPRLDDQPLDEITIEGGETVLVNTGVRIWIGNGNGGEDDFSGPDDPTVPRSSVGHKLNIMLGNTTGIIDADYQGELLMSLHNRGRSSVTLTAGTRVAQMVFVPYQRAILHEVDEFSSVSARGSGGYGSTGQ